MLTVGMSVALWVIKKKRYPISLLWEVDLEAAGMFEPEPGFVITKANLSTKPHRREGQAGMRSLQSPLEAPWRCLEVLAFKFEYMNSFANEKKSNFRL